MTLKTFLKELQQRVKDGASLEAAVDIHIGESDLPHYITSVDIDDSKGVVVYTERM